MREQRPCRSGVSASTGQNVGVNKIIPRTARQNIRAVPNQPACLRDRNGARGVAHFDLERWFGAYPIPFGVGLDSGQKGVANMAWRVPAHAYAVFCHLSFLLRSAPRPAASLALRAAGVALPPTVRQLADA